MLRRLLDDADPAQQAAAAVALRALGEDDAQDGDLRLRRLLGSTDPADREAALAAARHDPDVVSEALLLRALAGDSSEVRLAALRVVDAAPKRALLPAVVQARGDRETRVAARSVLRAFGEEDALYDLNRAFRRPDATRDLRVGAVRTIRDYGGAASMRSVLALLDREDLAADTESEVVAALLDLARATPTPRGADRRILHHIRRLAARAYWNCAAEALISDEGAAGSLVRDHYRRLVRDDLGTLLKLCVIGCPQTPVETIAYHVDTQGEGLADSLEVLDNVVPREARDLVMPLAEPRSPEQTVAAGRNQGLDLPTAPHQALLPLIESRHTWLAIVALSCGDETLADAVNWDAAPLTRDDAADLRGYTTRYAERLSGRPSPDGDNPMYSELEKTAYLKSTDTFRDIPGEEVFYVAQVAEEQHLADGESLFEDGDPGHSLYALIEGEILLHRGGQEVNRMRPYDAFGEMAVINQAPRTLSASAVGPTILLRISEEDFLHVLETRAEVMKGVMGQVMQRLSRLTDLYAEAVSSE